MLCRKAAHIGAQDVLAGDSVGSDRGTKRVWQIEDGGLFRISQPSISA